MVDAKTSEKKLDAKFASLDPDSLPTLNTYLKLTTEGKTDGKIGLVTPIPSSEVKQGITQRKSPNCAQILHYEGSKLPQESVQAQSHGTTTLNSHINRVPVGIHDQKLPATESPSSELSNDALMNKIGDLQAEIQALDHQSLLLTTKTTISKLDVKYPKVLRTQHKSHQSLPLLRPCKQSEQNFYNQDQHCIESGLVPSKEPTIQPHPVAEQFCELLGRFHAHEKQTVS